jgi:hypothetical protein
MKSDGIIIKKVKVLKIKKIIWLLFVTQPNYLVCIFLYFKSVFEKN